MTKEQTIELLQKQLPGFYSVEQVISIIKDLEEETSPVIITKILEDLLVEVNDRVKEVVDDMDDDTIVDLGSAEFDISRGNVLEVTSIDIERRCIIETIQEEITKVFHNQPIIKD